MLLNKINNRGISWQSNAIIIRTVLLILLKILIVTIDNDDNSKNNKNNIKKMIMTTKHYLQITRLKNAGTYVPTCAYSSPLCYATILGVLTDLDCTR